MLCMLLVLLGRRLQKRKDERVNIDNKKQVYIIPFGVSKHHCALTLLVQDQALHRLNRHVQLLLEEVKHYTYSLIKVMSCYHTLGKTLVPSDSGDISL